MASELRQTATVYLGFTGRNLLVYLKNRMTVFFSLLSPLIVLALYLLFLKRLQLNSIGSAIEDSIAYFSSSDIEGLVDANLLSGIVGTTMVTVPLGALQPMVEDRERKIDYDCRVAIKKPALMILGYITAAFIVTFAIALAVFLVGIGIEAALGQLRMTLGIFAMVAGTIALGSLSASSAMAGIIGFFTHTNAMSGFATIVSTLVGFVIGAYVPLAVLPKAVQIVASSFPASHATGILRNLLITPYLNAMQANLPAEVAGQWRAEMNSAFGLNVNFFGTVIGTPTMWIYLACTLPLFFALDVVVYRVSSRRK